MAPPKFNSAPLSQPLTPGKFWTRNVCNCFASFRLARENKEETYYFLMRDRDGDREKKTLS